LPSPSQKKTQDSSQKADKEHMKTRILWTLLWVVGFGGQAGRVVARETQEHLQQDTRQKAESRLRPLLQKYCKEFCELLDVQIETEETLQGRDDLGFEAFSFNPEAAAPLTVASIIAKVQIDKRVATAEKNRLHEMLMQSMMALGTHVDVQWSIMEVPQIGALALSKSQLEEKITERIQKVVQHAIEEYCPDRCILSNIQIDSTLTTQDEIRRYKTIEVVEEEGIFLHMKKIQVHLVVDKKISKEEKSRIINVMQAQTGFVGPISFDVQISEFPVALPPTMDTGIPFSEMSWTTRLLWIAGALGGLILLFLLYFLFRYMGLRQDAKWLMKNAAVAQPVVEDRQERRSTSRAEGSQEEKGAETVSTAASRGLLRLQDQLMEKFTQSPTVAKETMMRIMQEEGIEQAAKYLHIMGQMAVFELFSDPATHRNLYDLSEYYHKSDIHLELAEQEKLLQELRKKMLAVEIRMMTEKGKAQFEFLQRLDANDLSQLLRDESGKVQSIVLSQLPPEKRKTVFSSFSGDQRTSLLAELGTVVSFPKEYLQNVARALQKKAHSTPEGQSIRSEDILLQLLEKSPLEDQRALIRSLADKNPDIVQAIKSKLVSIEVLPYLKEGHLLELVLELDTPTLINFLAGTSEKIRTLFISHAPEELAQTWKEELGHMTHIEDKKYQVAEVSILNRLRHLVQVGVIHLADVNEALFGEESPSETIPPSDEVPPTA